MNLKTIVWDWNGTLLNDVQICIDSMNQLLTDRNLPNLSRQKYLEVFGFPVKEYYQKIGFDFTNEPFEIPALQFIQLYSAKLNECSLHSGAEEVLSYFQSLGYRQVILSAMEQSKLSASVNFLGIKKYFETIVGLNHDYATSKETLGKKLFLEYGIDPKSSILIGDTLHDAEVAANLGCNCILIANGHQNKERLEREHPFVLSHLKELNAKGLPGFQINLVQ